MPFLVWNLSKEPNLFCLYLIWNRGLLSPEGVISNRFLMADTGHRGEL